ncbi:MAG: protein-glutamate O-methyltransferase CheR [Deltaproteobacteria bacterium]|nr:protein-glutamate O-methyltransferase CheR [Deltaproteobacteria bacterium]
MPDSFELILKYVKKSRGLDLSGYRTETLRKRLAERVDRVGDPDTGAYLARLEADPEECDRLVTALAVHVTSFFRDPVVFELLEQAVLPAIVREKGRLRASELRVWSAGCGSGEEAYSLSILLDRALKEAPVPLVPLVFGTDVSATALQAAEAGIYGREQLENVKLGILDRYFVESGGRFQVTAAVRAPVRFSFDDVTRPGVLAPAESIFGGFDLVLCRNVLIYFGPKLQESVLGKLEASLAPGGFLVLGTSEHLSGPAAGRLEVLDARNRIYRKPTNSRRGPRLEAGGAPTHRRRHR